MNQDGKCYELIDHTGDLGIVVYGFDLPDLFRNAGWAFFDIVTDLSTVQERIERPIEVSGEGFEQLLINWLSELLYIHEVEGLLFTSFRIDELDTDHLKGVALGEVFDPERHVINTSIKAVTYHQIEVTQADGTWKGRVIFDL